MTHSVDTTGPVFISYRQSDGSKITAELAWLLRAAGVPVWRDKDDLPPGDTNERLHQALEGGLSGGVLVVTKEVAKSRAVKTIEAPKLIALQQGHPGFALCLVNGSRKKSGKTDYSAPDQLLGQPLGTLLGTDQASEDRTSLLQLVRNILWKRIAEHRSLVAANQATFSLSIQTRNIGQVYDRTGGQLDIRVRRSDHERLPDPQGLQDLAETLCLLPDAVTRSGAQRVQITGGAHLSVAFAVGAALPATRFGHLEVVDQFSEVWVGGNPGASANLRLLFISDQYLGTPRSRRRPEIGVYLDLTGDPSDAAYLRFKQENRSKLLAWQKLVSTQQGRLDPSESAALAEEAVAQIRKLSTDYFNAHIHLLLRCPFPLAVHIGRLTNTLEVTVYEWDNSGAKSGKEFSARFVPSLKIQTSNPNGPISEVLLKVDGSNLFKQWVNNAVRAFKLLHR